MVAILITDVALDGNFNAARHDNWLREVFFVPAHSQLSVMATPDEHVLRFIESELKTVGHIDGVSAFVFLSTLGPRRVTAAERAGLRLALAMYGEFVDPSAHALFRKAIGSKVARA
jgi:hypothetical protein